MDAYEQKIIGYVDILGWSSSCEDSSTFPHLREATQTIASHAQNFSDSLKRVLRNTQGVHTEVTDQHCGVEFSFFSDNFAVSVPIQNPDIVFKILAYASHHLLLCGFSVRGAVALGDLYHNRGIIFGPALVGAVELEKVAEYPRILCSNELIQFLEKINYKGDDVLRDHFGNWIVNTAAGTSHALDMVNEIVNDQLIRHEDSERITNKWTYIKKILPIMYAVRNSTS